MKNYINYILSILLFALCFNVQNVYSQATSAGPTDANTPFNISPLDYIGWTSGTSQPLNINNQDTKPINFLTGNTQRASILGSGNPGFFGIGSFTPAHKLDVDSGDIDVNQAASGYMINGNYVLRYKSAPCWA